MPIYSNHTNAINSCAEAYEISILKILINSIHYTTNFQLNPMGKQFYFSLVFFLLYSLIFSSVFYATARPLSDEMGRVSQMTLQPKPVTFVSTSGKEKRLLDLQKPIVQIKNSGPSPGAGHKVVPPPIHP